MEGRDYIRMLVRIRDNLTCQNCQKKWKSGLRHFDVHHLRGCGKKSRDYDQIKSMNDSNRLVTLCHRCHMNLNYVRRKMSNKSSPRPLKHKIYQSIWRKINKPWLNSA